MNYIAFAISATMFPEECEIIRTKITPNDIIAIADNPYTIVAANPSHKATIEAIKKRFGIELNIPAVPPKVRATDGESVYIIQVEGLPRLTDRHEYTQEEIENAQFGFYKFYVIAPNEF